MALQKIKTNFSWLALGVGLVFSLILILLSPLNPAVPVHMPLLMALFMAELGFIFTAAGAAVAIVEIKKNGFNPRQAALAAGNLILMINLLYFGFTLWPKTGFAY